MSRTFAHHVVVGAGGAIAKALVPELLRRQERVVLVSRHGTEVPGTSSVVADVLDIGAFEHAVPEGSVVYLLVGLPYDIRVWREQWPRLMANAIRVGAEKGALIVFFDNVYMYGHVRGTMTEETPHAPTSEKGDVRARIAEQLMEGSAKGRFGAIIARSADFYGPGAGRTGVPNLLVIDRLLAGKSAQWPIRLDCLHSLTYTIDCGRALAELASTESTEGQVWHLPTAQPPITMRRFIELAAAAGSTRPRATALPRWMLRAGGFFDRTVKELDEMLYQYEYDYVFDSTKIESRLGLLPTPYERGIADTVGSSRTSRSTQGGQS